MKVLLYAAVIAGMSLASVVIGMGFGSKHNADAGSYVVDDSQGGYMDLLKESDTTTFVVFVNEYACHDCFGHLDQALLMTKEVTAPSRIIAVVRCEQSSLDKKHARRAGKTAVPHADTVMLDVNTSSQPDPWPPIGITSGLFGEYGMARTPGLVILTRSGRPIVVRYEQLFRKELLDVEASPESNAVRIAALIRGHS